MGKSFEGLNNNIIISCWRRMMIWKEEAFLGSDMDVGYISCTLMGSRPYWKILLV